MELRNVRLDVGAVPRHWLGGRRSVSIFLDNLSSFFPLGERFFVESVRAHAEHVRDPALAALVQVFIGQEGAHSREHARWNRRLGELGYPVARMEARVDGILRLAARVLPPRSQLAVTCALEHLTALMAHMLLDHPRVLEDAHPTMAALWRWHAAEEAEHRAVAFDVFRAAGGTYGERATLMVIASAVFWAKVAEQQVRMMRTDGIAWSPREWVALFRFVLGEPAHMAGLTPRWLAYFRPGFHPAGLDEEALVESWKRRYECEPIYQRQAAGSATMTPDA
jgi:predicted metal-dependent hydrolase